MGYVWIYAQVVRAESVLVFVGGVWFIMFHVELFGFLSRAHRARARLAIMFPTALPHFACFSDRAEGQVDHRRKKYFLNKKD